MKIPRTRRRSRLRQQKQTPALPIKDERLLEQLESGTSQLILRRRSSATERLEAGKTVEIISRSRRLLMQVISMREFSDEATLLAESPEDRAVILDQLKVLRAALSRLPQSLTQVTRNTPYVLIRLKQ